MFIYTQPEWQGRIGKEVSLPPALKYAYNAHRWQLWACNDPNGHSYKEHGAKGITVRYTRRQLMQWVCDRIPDVNDASFKIKRSYKWGHFEFDNIYIDRS